MTTSLRTGRRIAALLIFATLAIAHGTYAAAELESIMLAGGGGLCGNGAPDPGEACDDGNTTGGDGCSAGCRIESGFQCSNALAPMADNAISNGNFESAPVDNSWTVSSTQFGSPLCTLGNCGGDEFVQPASGAGWLWLGGALTAESASIEQTVLLQPTDVTLVFDLAQNVCDGPSDTLTLTLDGNPVWTATGADPRCGDANYQRITLDLATAPGGPYNNGQSHSLRFSAQTLSLNGGESNFLIDNVGVIRNTTSGQPSACTPLQGVCQVEDFDPALSADFSSIGWTTFANANSVTGALWGTSDDAQCHVANGTPGNFTGRVGHSACIDSDAAGIGVTETYLCTAALDLRGFTQTKANFALSYHPFGVPDSDDVFEVLAGTTPPNSVTVETFATVWTADGTAFGRLFDPRGATINVDLSAYDDATEAYVCLRYRGDFDWSAQVDDFALTSPTCSADDADGDGVLNTNDNCINVSNPLQTDSNGDGIGNRCDADIAGPQGVGLDDCIVNVLDLAAFRLAFGSTPASANWNPHADFAGTDGPPDGRINAIDLGRLKLGFFLPPGPAAAGCQL